VRPSSDCSTAISAATDPAARLHAAGFVRARVKGAGSWCWARSGQLWEEYGALRQLHEEGGLPMMQIEITATDQLTTLDGISCRVWEGVTARGVRCKVFVHRIAVHEGEDSAQFDAELREQIPPGYAVPLRDVL